MRVLLAILGRELWLRRSVLLLALALGLVPVAISFYGRFGIPGTSNIGILSPTALSAAWVALIAGLAMLVFGSLSSGWSMMAPEAFSGRLGFFFARPVPWWAIWGGKLAAAVGLSGIAALLARLPSLLTASGQWSVLLSETRKDPPWPALVVLPVIIVGLANAASVAHRGQPARRAIDMLLLAAFPCIVFMPSRLLTVGAWSLGRETPYAVLRVPIALALVAGSAMQARGGRMESQRSHALLSLTVWSVAISSLAALAAMGNVMWRTSPSHLRRVTRVEAPRRGGWIFVAGPVRWGQYSAAFLYEPATGRHVSLGSARGIGRVSFAPDGSVAAVAEGDMFDPPTRRSRVIWLEGERRGLEKVFDFLPQDLSVSPRGEYLIAFSAPDTVARTELGRLVWETTYGRLEFYKLPSGALINSMTISALGMRREGSWDPGFLSPIGFQDDGRLRVYVQERLVRRDVHIVTADLPTLLVAGRAESPILASTGGLVEDLGPAPGSLGSELVIDEQGGLVRNDSKTGARTVLLGSR